MLWVNIVKCEVNIMKSFQRKEIKKRLKREKDPKVKLKLALLNMVASGMSVEGAASFLGIKLRTAYSWINEWIEGGYEAILVKKGGGRPPKLNKERRSQQWQGVPREGGRPPKLNKEQKKN